MTSSTAWKSSLPGRRSARARGFTLVELLLVMLVLSILVALVAPVGSYVIEQARISETITTQQTLVTALDAYRKATGDFPPLDANSEGDIEGLLQVLQAYGASGEAAEEIRQETMPYLGAQPGLLKSDAWGNEMRYYARRGIGGKPLILSAGPDGDFGDFDRSRQRDNVRSDTVGTDGRSYSHQQQ